MKGVSFHRNCDAASVEYNKAFWFYQLSRRIKLATVKSFKADFSSVSPSSERRANEGLTLETHGRWAKLEVFHKIKRS